MDRPNHYPCIIDEKPFFKINISRANSKESVLILREDLPKIVKRLCKIFKPFTINSAIIAIGGVVAMGTVFIRNSFSGLFECAAAALGACIGMLTPLYVGKKNPFALKRLIKSFEKGTAGTADTNLYFGLPVCTADYLGLCC